MDDSKKDEDIAGGDDPAIKLTTTEDDNTQKGLNATDDSVKDTDMGVVGLGGDVPAWVKKLALTGPADALMSRNSIFGDARQSKSGVGVADNAEMIHNKKLVGIYLTSGDRTSKDSSDPVKKLGFCKIGGSNTVDQLNNQQLKDDTATNTTTSLQGTALNKIVTPVWKLSQHQPRSASSAAIPRSVWSP